MRYRSGANFMEKSIILLSEVGGRRLIASGIFAGLVALILLISSLWSQFDWLYPSSLWLFLASSLLSVTGAVITTAARLDLLANAPKRARVDQELHRLEDAIQMLENKLQKVTATTTSKQDLQQLSEEVFKERIDSQIASISVNHVAKLAKDEIIANYKQNVFHERGFAAIREKIDAYIQGLHDELRSQRRAASQNLLWGVIFSIAGLGVMAFFLLAPFFMQGLAAEHQQLNEAEGWSLFLQAFIPKFTFVILFESIGFFFFRAYSDDRGMIKYLRNEATNVESRALALLSAIYFSNENQQDGIFRQLMSTERNFTLKRGEKLTVEALAKDSPILFEEIARRLMPKIEDMKFPNLKTSEKNPD